MPNITNPTRADSWRRFERFLLLGSESGAYLVSRRPLTLTSVPAVLACLAEDGPRAVKSIAAISTSGRAPKNDWALYSLALAASPAYAASRTNSLALAALPDVARTGAHLAKFAAFAESTRGWGRALRNAIAAWYTSQPAAELAMQVLKYRNRSGWSHRDLLRLAHPRTSDPVRNALFRYIAKGESGGAFVDDALRPIEGYERARTAADSAEVVRLIEDYRLTHETTPDQWKDSPDVWDALLQSMTYTALLRNLSRLTTIGLFAPRSAALTLTVSRLRDRRRIAQSAVHPTAILSALMAYRERHAESPSIAGALNEAFHLSCENIQPTGQRLHIALSGGAGSARCHGSPHVDTATGSAAIAMTLARPETHVEFWPAKLAKSDRLAETAATIRQQPTLTDASAPIRAATERKLAVDVFVIVTNSATWTADRHPAQALAEYRQATGIPAKLVVVALAESTVDHKGPEDAGRLDVAGFDASASKVISEFVGRAAA